MKNKGSRVVTTLIIDFSVPRAAHSEVRGDIMLKCKIIQGLMVGLLACKNEEDPSNNAGTRVVTTFSPIIYL